jgi:glycosyltransferase involved in cell wall biosynthesis
VRPLMITQKVDLDDDILGYVHGWIDRLAARVDHLHVLALWVGRHELPGNVTVYSMGKEGGAGRLKRLVRFAQVTGHLASGGKIDVIFAHQCPRYAILAVPYARLYQLPLVMFYAHRNVDLELRIAHRLVDQVATSVSTGFMLSSKKVITVGQGIDLNHFRLASPGDREGATVVSVGRLSPIKDYETLIRSIDILRRRYEIDSPKAVIVGGPINERDWRYLDKLKRLVEELGLAKCVEFVGPVPHSQVPGYLQKASIIVNLCPTGAVDKAALEGMACGRPVVVCNEGFRPTLGSHAPLLLFAEGDPVDLAAHLADLLRLPVAERDEIGLSLREAVLTQHNVEKLADNLTCVFQDAIIQKGKVLPG